MSYFCFECSLSYLDEINVHENTFSTSTPWIQENSTNQIVVTDFGYLKFDFWYNHFLTIFWLQNFHNLLISFQIKTYARMKEFHSMSLMI